MEEELVTKYATEEGEPELPQWVPQWGAARKTERLLRARQAKAEAEKARTAAKGLAAEEGLRVFIEYDASRSASPVMRAVMALRQRLYGPNTPNTAPSLGETSPLDQRQSAAWREEQLECAAFLQLRRSSQADVLTCR